MKHFIFGGRYGDIIHSLPAVYEYAMRTGTRPRFTTSQEHFSLLEGCSYLEPYAAPVSWDRIQDIVAHAKRMFPLDEIVNMACYGRDYSPGYYSWSYLRESWRLSQCPTPPESQPLVFDKRDVKRETALLKQLDIDTKPFILVTFAGNSSPFHQSNVVLADIQEARPDLKIVNISNLRAERIYDLLGVMERATALVTIDTMHLHLSAAVPRLPVFALITDGPKRWNRSDWRPQHIWRDTYSGYAERRTEFKAALKAMYGLPTIHHVWSSNFNLDLETKRRIDIAQASWHNEFKWAGNWVSTELHDKDFSRLFEADDNLPYARNIFDKAYDQCKNDSDIMSISNSDVGCVPGITGRVIDEVRANGCTFTYRRDKIDGKITTSQLSEYEIERWPRYGGSDWFFCSKKWWREHREECPDMVIGRSQWDCVYRQVMRKYGGKEIACVVWHEQHASKWSRPGNKENLPGQIHNRNLANQWYAQHKSNDQDPNRSTWNVVPNVTVAMSAMTACGLENPKPPGNSNLVFPRRLEFHRNNPFSRRLL